MTRSADLGSIPGLPEKFSTTTTLEMWRKTCFNHFFELEVARVYDRGFIKCPIYLSLGQEHIPAAVSAVSTDFMTFVQHRAHSWYLALGGAPRALADELLHRPTGCSGGMGGSASFHGPDIRLYGHSGLIGEQVAVAVGAALGAGRPALAVMGDAAAEEDYVFGAMGFAATKRVPVLFVCEDNDLSILTHVATRRSWSIVAVARSVGMPAVDITDDPWLVAHHVEELLPVLPAFLNVRTCRHRWHAGTGVDGEPEWDRFSLFREMLGHLGLGAEASTIEEESRARAEAIWREQLPRR